MVPKFQIIRSDRKTLSLQVTQSAEVLVRAPRHMKNAEIRAFVKEKEAWLAYHLERMRQKRNHAPPEPPPFSDAELEALSQQAVQILPAKVQAQAEKMGVTYGKITIRAQLSRWGSCTQFGDLQFNSLLMLCPPSVIDYLVVHELAHRVSMHHDQLFWNTVAHHCPDYRTLRAWLREEGNVFIARLRRKKTEKKEE